MNKKSTMEISRQEDNEKNLLPAFDSNNIAIATSSSNLYAPYLSVLIQSIISFSSSKNNYDIIVLNKDISDVNKKLINEQVMKYSNFSVRFVDTNKYIENRTLHTNGLAIETYFRFFLIDIMKNYDKVVYLDCDMIVNTDIKNIFYLDIGDNYLAAARDANLITCYYMNTKWTPYLDKIVKIKNPKNYFQAGLLLMNLKRFRKDYTLNECIDICSSYKWSLFDQDVLNMICQDAVYILNMNWNVMSGEEYRLEHIIKNAIDDIKEEYLAAREEPYVIHYCGKKKPWDYAETDYANYFWKQARLTPFYEIILLRNNDINSKTDNLKSELTNIKNEISNIKKSFYLFPVKRKFSVDVLLSSKKVELYQTIKLTASSKYAVGKCRYQFLVRVPGAAEYKEIQNSSNSVLFYHMETLGVHSFITKVFDSFGADGVKTIEAAAIKPIIKYNPVLPVPEKPRALFRCCTVFQLFNAINIKSSLLKDTAADIILNEATDFSEFIPKLKNLNLFENIITSNDTPETYFEWRRADKNTKINMIFNPEQYVHQLDLTEIYTDYYIAVVDDYNKLFYYDLIKKGHRPKIHIFEDGISTYLIDFAQECKDDIFDHSIYEKLEFIKNISELMLYQPDLHIESTFKCPIKALPTVDYQNKEVKNQYNSVFGTGDLPEEKYIFLEEAFVKDGISTTDTELLDYIANIVGKDNIRVKMHPRNNIDRFSRSGYKVVANSQVPWEITIMNAMLSDKVFITVSSTSAYTAGLVFGKRFRTIDLFGMMLLGKNVHVRNPKYHTFYEKLCNFLNAENKQIFHPQSYFELRQQLIYLESGADNDD